MQLCISSCHRLWLSDRLGQPGFLLLQQSRSLAISNTGHLTDQDLFHWVPKGQSECYAASLPQQGTPMCPGNAGISNIGTGLLEQTLLFLGVPVHTEEFLLKCVFTQNITRIVKAGAGSKS